MRKLVIKMHKLFIYQIVIFVYIAVCPLFAEQAIYVVFRYDDFSGDKSGFRQTNRERNSIWIAEQEVDRLFKKYNMKYVVSIIPNSNTKYDRNDILLEPCELSFSLDIEKVKFIKNCIEEGRIEVAQHGYSHANYVPRNHRAGEFRARNYEKQLKDIEIGHNILTTTLSINKISTFVPPWNGWDKNTAKALKELGFSVLSADFRYWHSEARGLKLVPFTSQLWDLEEMLCQGSIPNGAVFVVLYHPVQIAELPNLEHRYFGLERFEKLLSDLAERKNIHVVTLSELAEMQDLYDIDSYKAGCYIKGIWNFWESISFTNVLPIKNIPPFFCKEKYNRLLRNNAALTVIFFIFIVVIGFMLRAVLYSVIRKKYQKTVDFLGIVIFLASIASQIEIMSRGYFPTGIRAMPGLFCFSFVIFYVFSKSKGISSEKSSIGPQ
jgi:ABC-type sugar transport system permease subunit